MVFPGIIVLFLIPLVNGECSYLSNGDLYCEYGMGTLEMSAEFPVVNTIELVNMFVNENCDRVTIPAMVKHVKVSPVQYCACLCWTSENTTSNCVVAGNSTKCIIKQEILNQMSTQSTPLPDNEEYQCGKMCNQSTKTICVVENGTFICKCNNRRYYPIYDDDGNFTKCRFIKDFCSNWDLHNIKCDKNGSICKNTRYFYKCKCKNGYSDISKKGEVGTKCRKQVPAQPAPNRPAPARPAKTQPAESRPAPAQPAESRPAPARPAPAQPALARPVESQPTPARSAPAQPAKTQPAEPQPAPAQPAPARPAPVQPALNQPVESQPTPARSAPAQPAKTQPAEPRPAPARPAPARPAPAQPALNRPVASQPTPARSAPAQPAKTRLAPAQPAPARPAPAQPAEVQPALARSASSQNDSNKMKKSPKNVTIDDEN